MRTFIAFVVAASLLAACAGEDEPTLLAGDDTTSSSAATSSSAPPGTFVVSELPASRPAGTTRAYLKDVRVGAHSGYDRVTFEFEDALPGYEIAVSAAPVAEDGSGDEVRVRGEALLQARFENTAGARIEGERVVEVHTGPKRLPGADARVVTEVVDAGDFEGVVTWVIGLRRAASGVRVSALESPHRVVIDIPTDS